MTSGTVELDPDRLRGLAERLEGDARTVTAIRDQLTATRLPACVTSLVERAVSLTSDFGDATGGTASLASRIVAEATAADGSAGGRPGPWATPFTGGPWWSRSNYDPGAPLERFDWSSIDGPADLRSAFRHFTDRLGADAWGVIPPDARLRLIDTCPELVVEFIVIPGGDVSAAEQKAILEADSYDKQTDVYSASLDGRVPMDVDAIVVGEFELKVARRADGKVWIIVGSDLGGGVGLSTKNNKKTASADATSVYGERMTFEFDSMKEAQAAIDDLRSAASGGVQEATRPPSRWEWMGAANPVAAMIVGGRRVHRALTADSVTETLANYGRHLDRIEVSDTFALSGSGELGSMSSLSLLAGSETKYYYSDEVDGDDDHFGMEVKVTATGSAAAAIGAWANGSGLSVIGTVTGSAAVEQRMGTDGQARLILTLDGEVSGAVERELDTTASKSPATPGSKPGLTPGIETSETAGRAASLVVDIPIDDTTSGAAEDLVRAIATGDDPGPALDALHDAADITLTTKRLATETFGVQAGALGSASVGHEERSTDEVQRKRPYGDWYSQSDLVDMLSD